MSVTHVYSDNYDGLLRHLVSPADHDLTLCDELIDARDGFHADADPDALDITSCTACEQRAREQGPEDHR